VRRARRPGGRALLCVGELAYRRHNCSGCGKCPAVAWRTLRFPATDEDAEQYVRWNWNPEDGKRGFAVHLGKSHLVALDADERNGGLESLSRLKQKFLLPDTWQDDRLSGGVSLSPHFYFQEPPEWVKLRLPSAIRLFGFPGIE